MGMYKKGTDGYYKALEKRRATLLEHYGGEEGVHEYYSRIGAMGGKVISEKKKHSGFGKSKEWARLCGYKGGRLARHLSATEKQE